MADGTAPVQNEAQRLAAEARPYYRRYAAYLLVFGVGAFLAAVTIGTFHGPVGKLACVILFGGPLVALVLHFRSQRRNLKRFALLHNMAILTWAGVWIITVLFGLMAFGDLPTWWLVGGIAAALPGLLAAAVVYRAAR